VSDAIEMRIREYLWLTHGHGLGYGDDGEMQCSRCEHWDYKRTPLDILVEQAHAVRIEMIMVSHHSESKS